MADQLDFESWGREIVAGKHGMLASELAFNNPPAPPSAPPPGPARSCSSSSGSQRRRPDPPGFRPQPPTHDELNADDLVDGCGLEAEVKIRAGDWCFVLTPSRRRARHWSEQDWHVGITPREINELSEATGGAPIDRKLLFRIVAVKRAFPGAHVLEAIGSGYDG